MRAPTSKETKKTASGPTTTTLPPHESTHQKGIHTVRNKLACLRVLKIDAIEKRAALQNKICASESKNKTDATKMSALQK